MRPEERYPYAGKGSIKRFARLHQKKYRDREGCFLAEGLRTVTELLGHMPSGDALVALFVLGEELGAIPVAERYRKKLFLLEPEDMKRLAGTTTSQGVIGVFRVPPGSPVQGSEEGRSLVVALDDVQDPGNVGTIVRTAAWFGASSVISGRGTADIYNPKSVRSSAGSLYGIGHYSVDDLEEEIAQLQQKGYHVVTASLQGTDLRERSAWPQKAVLVIGNEANGVSPAISQMSDSMVMIPHGPGSPGVESLNAAIAAAILISRMSIA